MERNKGRIKEKIKMDERREQLKSARTIKEERKKQRTRGRKQTRMEGREKMNEYFVS
jgi:hypothetical protein